MHKAAKTTFSLLLLLLVVPAAIPSHARNSMNDKNRDRLAARILISFLRSIVRDTANHVDDRVVLAPSKAVLTYDAAVTMLANRAKPLACRASVHEGIVHVYCTRFARDDSAEWMFKHPTSHVGPEIPPTAKVRIVEERSALIVEASAFAAFEQQYAIDMPYLVVGDSPTLFDRLRGIRLVLQPSYPAQSEYHVLVPHRE
jgi:hypothetical protein